MYGFSREAVRIKVKKCEGRCQPELRKFSVDPQITSLEILQSILIKAFELKSEFTICYKTLDEYGTEIHLPILSDWDLDTAFLKAHNIAVVQRSEPCVNLRIDMKTFTECDDEEEGIPAQESLKGSDEQLRGPQGDSKSGIHGLIMNQVERTFNMVTRALNFHEDPTVAPRPPLNDAEFRSYLDPVGRIINDVKLREAIYCGGIEPSLRKVVWKHILNVYPEGMTGRERMDYMKQKATEYYTLRNNWKECIQKGQVNSDVAYVTTMVRKDVLRTDRHHEFYAGSDDNQNIASLFNILTTYALNHPKVSYCQGMSDLASPLLVTMVDEAQAYICLCALMCRLYTNFMLDGEAMTVKFAHLTEALQVYDNEFYTYLKMHQADDLLFCYRWLLLEMKREFAFEDALRMLEVLWASLPPKPPDNELKLKEQEFDPSITIQTFQPDPVSPMNKTPRETAYTKVCEIRRKSSTFSLLNATNSNRPSFKKMNHSLDENVIRKSALKHVKEFQSLDDTALRLQRQYSPSLSYTIDENCEKKTNILTNGQDEITLGGQLRQLRDKISTHNNKFFTSLEKLDGHINTTTDDSQVKIIKNLNEFLTLANKSKTIKSEHARSRNESDISDSTLDDSEVFTDSKSEKKLMENSSPDDSQDYYPMTSSITRKLRLELEHLDRQVFGPAYSKFDSVCDSPSSERKPIINIEENSELNENIEQPRKVDGVFLWENPLLSKSPSGQRTPDEQVDLELDGDTSEATNTFCDEIRAEKPKDSSCEINDDTDSSSIEPNVTDALLPNNSKNEKTKQYKFFSNMSHELENARKSCEILLNAKQTNKLHSVTDTITNIQKKYEQLKINPADRSFISPQPPMQLAGETLPSTKWTVNNLPIPSEFGCGNPFLMFLCLTILLQHRDYIMRNKMDYNELAMHFDKMVRKHNVNRVLNQARQMYIMYQKQHPTINHIVM